MKMSTDTARSGSSQALTACMKVLVSMFSAVFQIFVKIGSRVLPDELIWRQHVSKGTRIKLKSRDMEESF